MTELIRGLYNIKSHQKGAVVTIGNFDGIHLGHKLLIDKLKEQAEKLSAPAIIITFEPQPLEYFTGGGGSARLTRWREKFHALAETKVDAILVLPFNQKLADLSAQAFVDQVLVQALAIKQVIIGDDFRFGFKREGDFDFLNHAGKVMGFDVKRMPSVMLENERISSTLIRQRLAEGNHTLAERLLGRPYTMMGRVVHGNKLGRQLGFPTANIFLHRHITPVQGIYIVRMHNLASKALPGVANVGIRPTIGGTRSLLEVYLFNFDRDIYGQHVCVEFCKKLRDEERYDNLELLKEAITKDAAEARHYFEKLGEL